MSFYRFLDCLREYYGTCSDSLAIYWFFEDFYL